MFCCLPARPPLLPKICDDCFHSSLWSSFVRFVDGCVRFWNVQDGYGRHCCQNDRLLLLGLGFRMLLYGFSVAKVLEVLVPLCRVDSYVRLWHMFRMGTDVNVASD